MTIAAVSKQTGLSADTLRYYERIGLIPPVPRNKAGIRNYDDASLRWIKFAQCMRGAGLPVEILVEYNRLFRQGDSTHIARKTLLMEQRDILAYKIEELKGTLDKLNRKIDNYDTLLRDKEGELEW